MISNLQVENRISAYFKILFDTNAVDYGFDANVENRFLVDRQTNAPRPDAETLLLYRIEENKNFGLARGSSRSVKDRNTNEEFVEVWKDVHVIVNVISQSKGKAKDAVNFLLAAVNSERDYNASTSEVLPFDLTLHRIANDIRNLTDLETEAWQERIELDMYFNYKDTVSMDPVEFLTQPNEATDVPSIVQWETTLKE